AAAHTLAVGQHLKGGVYEIQQILGSGSSATTYQARVRDTGQLVAVKALSLAAMRGWKQLDLFQREAQVLSGLSHPGIPRYLDHFEEDDAAGLTFYIVQVGRELVSGDIKPDNILLRGGRWGGQVVLVGTYGYMAPEQFRGAAQPASDLYALGATLLFLLSGQPPFAFPQERMRIDWLSSFKAPSPLWTQLLDGLLEPVAEDRLTAEQAIDLLNGRALYTRPLPGKGLLNLEAASSAGFAVVWNAFVLAWTERLSLSRSTFSLSQELATLNSDKQQAQFTADLLGARVATTMIVNGSPVTVVEVLEGVRVHRFGEGLDWAEQQWLVAEINKAVADLQGRVVVPEHFPPPEPPRIAIDR
ncbi:protein kinase domain-containing protein, partial [Haematococcus lacustris]